VVATGKFGFYSGLNVLDAGAAALDYAEQTLANYAFLYNTMKATEETLRHESYSPPNDATQYPVNCARWVVLAFPEAGIFCPGGVPRLCTSDSQPIQPALKEGLQIMGIGLQIFADVALKFVSDAAKEMLFAKYRLDSSVTLSPGLTGPSLAAPFDRAPGPLSSRRSQVRSLSRR
jgi:hypothetical protein